MRREPNDSGRLRPPERQAALARMAEEVTVALVEAVDFAAGTSSRSSKLLHGGLRYHEQGNLNRRARTAAEAGLDVARVGHLLHRHGVAIDELLDLIAEVPDLAERAAEAQPDDQTADPVRRQAADLRATRPDTAA